MLVLPYTYVPCCKNKKNHFSPICHKMLLSEKGEENTLILHVPILCNMCYLFSYATG